MELVRLGYKVPIRLQAVDDPVDIRFRTQADSFGNNFVGRRHTVQLDVCTDEIQN
jgi:hypothetical protein